MFTNFFNPGEKYEDNTKLTFNNSQNNNSVTFNSDEFFICLKENMGFDILNNNDLKSGQMRGKISLFDKVRLTTNSIIISGVFCIFHYAFTFFYNNFVRDHQKWKYCHEEF